MHEDLLTDLRSGVAEEVVDGEELGHETGLRVGSLRGEEGVSEALVVSGGDLGHEGAVVLVGGAVEGESGG
jgi:hypothetical protein